MSSGSASPPTEGVPPTSPASAETTEVSPDALLESAPAGDHELRLALGPLIERTPFLRLLPPAARQQLLGHFRTQAFGFGQLIVREGEAADAFYLLATGRARVLKRAADGGEIPLHVLVAGDSFGEIGILNGGVRTATVRACEKVTVLRLERQAFQEVLQANPALGAFLRLQMEHRRLHAFLRQYTQFGHAPLPALEALLKALRPVSFTPGQIIFRDGEAAGPLYIIESGQVRILKEVGGEPRGLAFLRAGDFFGEFSLLEGCPRFATAVAHGDCRLLALAPDALASIQTEFPEFRLLVEDRVAEYRSRHEARQPLDFTQAAVSVPSESEMLSSPTLTVPAGDPLTTTPPDRQARPARPSRARLRRFPFVPQVDEADCGAACLAMVARFHGRAASLTQIRELCYTSTDGAALNDLCRAATELGLAARPVKHAPSDAGGLALPAILHWDGAHWVVLLELTRRRARIADPAEGLRWVKLSELTERWTGYAVELVGNGEAKPLAAPPPSWAWLRPFLSGHRAALTAVFSLAVLISGLQLFIPRLTQIVVDTVIGSQNLAQLNIIVASLGGILGVVLLLTALQRRLLANAAAKVDGDILNFIMDKMLSLPMTYFLRRRAADIQRRLEGVRGVRRVVVHHAIGGLLAAVHLLACLGMMAWYSLPMTLFFLAIMLPLYAGLLFFAGKILRPAFASIEDTEGRFQGLQHEIVAGIEAVKASGAEQRFREATVSDFRLVTSSQSLNRYNIALYEGTVQSVWLLSSILLLWLGARLVMTGPDELSLGAFMAFFLLIFMTWSPVQSLVNLWEEWQSASVLLGRLNDLVEYPAEQSQDPAKLRPVSTLAGKVEARNLSYRYGGPDSPLVLRELNFSVRPGQKVAIVGRSGSGKTTLAKCLATLLEPSSGALRFDDVDARTVRHHELRRHFGVVLHDNYVFTGSVLDNIAFGDPAPNRDRVAWAASAAGLESFVTGLPRGLDSVIGDGGVVLSRGQRQCLAIARAIYRKPSVFILDEATNDLDVECERNVQERLVEIMREHTVFIITHRLTTIRHADLILVMDRGQLVEQGRHEDLLVRRGLYAHLLSRQIE